MAEGVVNGSDGMTNGPSNDVSGDCCQIATVRLDSVYLYDLQC